MPGDHPFHPHAAPVASVKAVLVGLAALAPAQRAAASASKTHSLASLAYYGDRPHRASPPHRCPLSTHSNRPHPHPRHRQTLHRAQARAALHVLLWQARRRLLQAAVTPGRSVWRHRTGATPRRPAPKTRAAPPPPSPALLTASGAPGTAARCRCRGGAPQRSRPGHTPRNRGRWG